MKAIRTFRNARIRLLRSGDGTWHAGWVIHLAQREARIRLNDPLCLRLGETLVGEIYGDGTRVRFAGRVDAQVADQVAIEVQGSMLFQPSRIAVRFHAPGMVGTLSAPTHESRFVSTDVSPKSLGGFSELPFKSGNAIQLSLATPCGTFGARVLVAHCEPVPAGTGSFRIGLQMVETSRLDSALWQRFLEERAECADLQSAA